MVLLGASAAAAQDGFGFQGAGVRGGFRLDPDQLILGGQLDLGDLTRNLRLMPNATVGFGDDLTLICIDPEVHYCFRDNPIGAGTWFYAGGGIDFVYSKFDVPETLVDLGIEVDDSDTSVGVSLTGGISYQLSSSQSLMGEVRVVLEDESFFEIVGAWNFGR
jgi:hypothetical protein